MWAEQRATDGGTLLNRVEYSYDAFGNRLKRVQKDGSLAVVSDERYAYDGWDTAKGRSVGGEAFDAWADLSSANVVTMRRVYGGGFDEPVARVAAGGATGWYLTDRLGSVRVVADNAGAVLGSREYAAFGAITVASGAGLDRYAYTAREWDATLGLQFSRARLYDPATGRFTSEDPMGLSAGDVNLHRYAGNAVTVHTDPSGMFWGDIGELGGVFVGEVWNGIKQLPGSVGRNALEIGRVGYDVIGYNVQNLTNAFEMHLYGEHNFRHNAQSQLFQQLSGGGMTNEQLGDAALNLASLGAWELGKGYGEYLADGDADKFRERMNGLAFNNLTGAGTLKLLKCRAARANAEPRPTAPKRALGGGVRNSEPLTELQIQDLRTAAGQLGLGPEDIRFLNGPSIYSDLDGRIWIGPNILPSSTATGATVFERMTARAAIAHERGHLVTSRAGTALEGGSVLDEIQASLVGRQSRGLSNVERYQLLRGAAEDARKAGLSLRDLIPQLPAFRR